MPKNPLLLLAIALSMAPPALAQNRTEGPAKKLYCWDADGQRVCSDALPAEAVNRAREEISARNGMRTATFGRVLSEEERARAASEEFQRQVDQAAVQTRRRTDQAMLLSYPSEDELKRVFTERTGIVDNSIRMSAYNVTSLREGLVTLLQTASNRELDGQPVSPEAAASIRRRHAELLRQRQMQASFERQRKELDAEIGAIMQRYRQLKQIQESKPAANEAIAGEALR
jgi:hypothetical protein